MARKPTSYGQFDRGAGEKYAPKKKSKSRARERSGTRAERPSPSASGGSVREETMATKVAADMRKHKRSVLRMGR